MAKHEHVGAAPKTTLSSGINASALSFTVAAGAGYPTGGVGPFVVVMDRGLATEEKILCDSRSGNSFTVNASGRGYDNTTAQAHASAAYVEHALSAAKIQELDTFVNTAMTGDVTASANSKVTTIAAGAVGTTKVADDAITLAKIQNIATASFLGRTTASTGDVEVLSAAQALALLALDSTDLSDFTEAVQDLLGAQTGLGGSGLTYSYSDAGNAVALVVNVDGTTIEISSDALRVKDGGITRAKVASEARSTSWTPTLNNSGRAAVTKNVLNASVWKQGYEVSAQCMLRVTSGSSGTGVIELSAPHAPQPANGGDTSEEIVIGYGSFFDASALTYYHQIVTWANASSVMRLYRHGLSTGEATQLAIGDEINLSLRYVAAS